MGVLYHASTLQKNMQQRFVLERLEELKALYSPEGKSIYEMTYQELLVQLVLAEMRQVDIEHPSHEWFK